MGFLADLIGAFSGQPARAQHTQPQARPMPAPSASNSVDASAAKLGGTVAAPIAAPQRQGNMAARLTQVNPYSEGEVIDNRGVASATPLHPALMSFQARQHRYQPNLKMVPDGYFVRPDDSIPNDAPWNY